MNRLAWLVALLAVFPASSAFAVVPSTMSYQGVLTDAGGNLVLDGNYSLTFRIFNVSVGGVALYTENHPAVPVQLGGFSVIIGSITPIGLGFDEPYWLEIQVGADPALSPRIPLAASPYGLSLRLPFAGPGSSAGPLFEIRNGGTGPAIRGNVIDAGSSGQDGIYRLFANGAASPTVEMFNTAGGARIWGRRSDGNDSFRLEEDANGSGGFFHVWRSSSNTGFFVDGNSAGSEEPLMAVTGSVRSASFNMGIGGNASVILPGDAVGSTEMIDEPGVAHVNASNVALGAANATLLSRTITCPMNGYVVVLGSVDAQINHATGNTSIVTIGVSDVAASLPAEQDFQVNIPGAAPSGTWDSTVGAHGVFAVTSGANTFYLVGRASTAGSANAFDMNLTTMFFPTAYGTVTPPAPQTGPSEAQQSAIVTSHGMTAGDLAAERAEAEAFNAARMQRELTEIRRELEQLKLDVSLNGRLAKER